MTALVLAGDQYDAMLGRWQARLAGPADTAAAAGAGFRGEFLATSHKEKK